MKNNYILTISFIIALVHVSIKWIKKKKKIKSMFQRPEIKTSILYERFRRK